jgi:alpha,alpha-trehalase
MRERREAGEPRQEFLINLSVLDAFLVDLDGVVTETARIHAGAWKAMFDGYLKERAVRLGGVYRPFDRAEDYVKYVDGKPRYDGVAGFLASRGIDLPLGDEDDPPDRETVCGLGNRKNQLFLEMLGRDRVDTYASSVDVIRHLKRHGLKVAVVTSSRNCREVLESAGLDGLFDAQVDGIVAREWMLNGKPAPDIFWEAARRLGVDAGRAAVVEDSIAGVQAGRAGNFALVIGVSRAGHPELLQAAGADIVVSDMGELQFQDDNEGCDLSMHSALDNWDEIRARLKDRRAAVFLDYDGTLTPIVERPDLAILSPDIRATLERLSKVCTVVIVSGRERRDVARLVGSDGIVYAGAHGFDIAGPAGTGIQHKEGASFVPVIAEAAKELRRLLAPIHGVIVEDKTYAIAVHYRMVDAEDVARVEKVVDTVLAHHTRLRKTGGKKVFELRPDIPWDKGKAVLWLLDALDLDRPDIVPIYLGDDVTDHDAFDALRGKGLSVLVSAQLESTSADYRLADTSEVADFLNDLATMLSERER